MRTEKIKVDRYSLATLMQDMAQGRIRIPRFQREFVWERSRIQTLLDSMYKEYPIGTIFLWDAPPENNHLLRDIEELNQPAKRNDVGYSFILDGQQRLTSLFAATNGLTIDGEDYSKIVIDLSGRDPAKLFQYRKPDNQRWVAIKDLLAGNVFDIYNNLPSDDFRQLFQEARSLILNYPFSVVVVSAMALDDAIEIFERINQQGKRLSRYDLISASVLTTDFDLRERTEQDIIEPLESKGFGLIPETSIPQALALNLRGSTETTTQMNLKKEEIQEYWERTCECFMLAVDFVRRNLGVVRAEFLPYDAVIPVLAYYFFYANTNSISNHFHREQLEYWFWRTAFSERYSAASQTRMSDDAAWIRSLIDDDSEISLPMNLSVETLTQGSMRTTTSAVRNGLLCVLSLLRPRHFESGEEIDISTAHFSSFTRAEKHHIFPQAFLNAQGFNTREIHRLPNFCFIPAELNKKIADTSPSEYFEKVRRATDAVEFERICQSHLLPADEESGLWVDDYELFLQQRAKHLIDEIQTLAGVQRRIEPEVRNPLIDSIETALRDTIHETLTGAYGHEYWKPGIAQVSGETSKAVMERIENHVQKTPGKSKGHYQNLRARLDFLDVSDYERILLRGKNWQLFTPIFRSKNDCKRFLNDFRDFRNAIKHGRDIDSVLELNGQASITWLANAMNLDLSDYGIT